MPKKLVTRAEIEYALETQRSLRAASMYLGLSYNTFRKYAKMHKDLDNPEQTLLEKFSNQGGKGKFKYQLKTGTGLQIAKLSDILQGKHPGYDKKKLRNRLIQEHVLEERCVHCGFCEHRMHDHVTPVLLNFKDKNTTNHSLENLEFLCFNCYFLFVGNFDATSSRIYPLSKDIPMERLNVVPHVPAEFYDKDIDKKVEEHTQRSTSASLHTPQSDFILSDEDYAE